jgi:hypothetical protein
MSSDSLNPRTVRQYKGPPANCVYRSSVQAEEVSSERPTLLKGTAFSGGKSAALSPNPHFVSADTISMITKAC